MKKHLFYLFAFSLCAFHFPSAAQDLSRKFGDITDYEIDMSVYAPDTSAVAVYLYEDTKIAYRFGTSQISNLFQQSRYYSVKIKILKPEGVSLADVEIPYLYTSDSKEHVTGLSVSAYNRVGGKIVETSLRSRDFLTEQVSEKLYVRKFTIPEVRVGTVIEYKYAIDSDYYFDIRPLYIQHAHPVIYSSSEVAIPEYFSFNVNTTGYHPISESRAQKSTPDFIENTVILTATDVPGLDSEPLVWSIDDFRTKVSFELRSINIPGVYHKDYTTSWEAVDKVIAEGGFNEYLRMRNPLRDEVAEITASETDETTRLRKIHRLVVGRMNWNGEWRLRPNSARQRLAEGSGSSADINFVLNSALRDAGFTTTPVLLNPRRSGRIPLFHPSIDNINTFVLSVTLSDGSTHILDGTDPDNDIDVIPTSLMVDRAHVFGKGDGKEAWVDLTGLTRNTGLSLVQCSLEPSGTISGSFSNAVGNALAARLKSEYRDAGSEEKYIESKETENGMTISSYTIEGLDTSAVTEKMEFTTGSEVAGEFIYLRATVLPFITTNPLVEQERNLPVEFSMPARYSANIILAIPEGYTVEELPKAIRMSVCEDGATFSYQAGVMNGNVVIRMDHSLNRLIFNVEEYPELQSFFSLMTEKNNSRIILKKI